MAMLSVEAFKTNVTLTGTAENDLLDALTGGGNNTLRGGDGDDELFAYSSDKLYGEAGNDKLHSEGNGNNTLSGGDGDDYIYADRNDIVFGDAGDDTIFNGLGSNTITGGAGKDIFWLANAAYPNNPNIITDFNPAEDSLKVNLDGITTLDKLTFTPSGSNTVISANSKALAILQNYELPIFSISSASATEGNIINFTVTRTGNNQASQSVTVSTSINQDDTASANDLTPKSETLTFAQGETTKIFAVQTTQDNLFEGNETFSVSLSNPNNISTISSTNGTVKGTITNDDVTPIFAITSASATEGNAINFTITRTGNSQLNQNITVSTSINQADTASANDLTPKSETLTFAQGETTKTFTVQTTQDQRVEKDETFNVSLSNPTNGAIISSTNGTTKGKIINDDIPLAYLANSNIFTIKGENDTVRLKVSLVDRNSSSKNELGVFVVDDPQGNINGIAPGAAGYNQAALDRSKVAFSGISDLPRGLNSADFTRLLGFNSGDNLRFFLVKDGTIDSLKAGKIPSSNLLFANASNQRVTDLLGNDSFRLSWEDGSGNPSDFRDIVVRIQSTNDSLVAGTTLQGSGQGETIDLREIKGQVKADFSVYREASFNNEVYFYKVDNADGQIGNLQANSANSSNYLQAALNNLVKDAQTGANIRFAANNQGVQNGTTTITGGTIIAPLIIINGTLSQLLDSNPNNNPQVYFPYLGVNSDGVDHIRLLGNNLFGFEDLPNGGDLDYNDIIVKINFTPLAA